MSEMNYLVAIALLKEENKRAMPLGGKSNTQLIKSDLVKGSQAETIVLELLLRIFQKSHKIPIQVHQHENCLLLVEITLEKLQNDFPPLKSEWIHNGNDDLFLSRLNKLSLNLWSLEYIKYEGIKLNNFS